MMPPFLDWLARPEAGGGRLGRDGPAEGGRTTRLYPNRDPGDTARTVRDPAQPARRPLQIAAWRVIMDVLSMMKT
jgi:hypothetical protein